MTVNIASADIISASTIASFLSAPVFLADIMLCFFLRERPNNKLKNVATLNAAATGRRHISVKIAAQLKSAFLTDNENDGTIRRNSAKYGSKATATTIDEYGENSETTISDKENRGERE